MKSKTSHQSNENFVWETQFPVVLSIVDKSQNFHDKTRMKSKTSHQSNENFVWETQFPVVLSIIDKSQNFHDKFY